MKISQSLINRRWLWAALTIVSFAMILVDLFFEDCSYLPNWLGFVISFIGLVFNVLYFVSLFLKMVHDKMEGAKQLVLDIPRAIILAINPILTVVFIMALIEYLR